MYWKAWALVVLAWMSFSVTVQGELPLPADENHAAVTETQEERDERMSWWREAKFGMFIHYGLYSGLAGEFRGEPGGTEWIQTNLGLDSETYAQEALPLFRPAPGCADAWVELARAAGCRYAVLTTKHHEGFALFGTKEGDFHALHATGRDLVKEFAEACRKNGLRVGFYHSVIDWHHPAYDNTICPDLCYPVGQAESLRQRGIPRNQSAYQTYLHHQVRELLTQYGKVDILWWDYSQGAAEGQRAWRAPELIRLCRELQPGIIMNNRLYAFSGLDPQSDRLQLDLRCGDFTTPEKHIPEEGYPGVDWEACMTVGDKWGFNRYDRHFKSPSVIIRQLEECAARGGNLLLNIGPRADGSIPDELVEVFTRVGKWMKINGEAIYGSVPVTSVHLPEGWLCSLVQEEAYLFPPAWEEVPSEDVVLRIPAHEIDAVEPSVLGQPTCVVKMERVEEPGEEEPRAFIQLTIPAQAWRDAVEGMPVVRLSNAN